jgi:hypothetical protein
MSEFDEFDTNSTEGEEFNDAFSSMESALSQPVSGNWIQLRNGGNAPKYVPLFDGEEGISISQALGRANLTIGVVTFYVDNAAVSADTIVPNHGVVEIIGTVKGGVR